MHFIVENTIDIDTIQVLKFVLGIGFNTNIQNLDNDNETVSDPQELFDVTFALIDAKGISKA